jgi:hypothetical protein
MPEAIGEYFRDRAQATRRSLRELLRTGRTSLVIGLAFNAGALILADQFADYRYSIVHDSLVIGGWVAMWRPIEVFLYDWWPVRSEARLYDRLAAMPVRVVARRRRRPHERPNAVRRRDPGLCRMRRDRRAIDADRRARVAAGRAARPRPELDRRTARAPERPLRVGTRPGRHRGG